MDTGLILKFVGTVLLFASLFYLVVIGKMSASDFQTLAVGALGALGGFHAGRFPGKGGA